MECSTHETHTPLPRIARVGIWLRDHQKWIWGIQWAIVLIYAFLLIIPAIMPLPGNNAHILNNLTVFAEFVFWGIWWPFVLVSIVLFGRLWCGVLCPEGALSEWSAKHGKGLPIPRWMRWKGWPFVAFGITTVYGQLVSVYQYPKAALLVLGGSTVAAMIIGFLYTKGKRAWCRHLCPVNGVFALLAKISPIYYKVNQDTWDENTQYAKEHHIQIQSVNCAPLQPLRTMEGNSGCHMCGRCADYRGAINLSFRAPATEIIENAEKDSDFWQTMIIVVGLLGIAIGAFHWTASPYFWDIRDNVGDWLINHNIMWPLDTNAPWFVLTNYPDNNDTFSWVDGGMIVAYILTTAFIISTLIMILLSLSVLFSKGKFVMKRVHHLAQSLIPIAAAGVFLGLSATTVTLLKNDQYPTFWANDARLVVLVLVNIFCLYLGAKILRRWQSWGRVILSFIPFMGVLAVIDYAWYLMFWGWK